MPEWFEDEEFWEATSPFMFPGERLALGEEHAVRRSGRERVRPEDSRLVALARKAA